MQEHDKERAFSSVQETALSVAKHIQGTVDNAFSALAAITEHPAVINHNPQECDRLFAKLLPSYPEHLNIIAADMSGNNYGSATEGARARRLNYRDRQWFSDGIKGKPVIGDLHISKLFGIPAVMIASPVYGADGGQTGVVGLPLNLDKLRQRLAGQYSGLPQGSSITILDSKGDVILSTAGDRNASFALHPRLVRSIVQSSQGSFEHEDINNGTMLIGFSSFDPSRWKIIASLPDEQAYRHTRAVHKKYLLMLISIGLVAAAGAAFLGKRMAKNVSSLVSGLREIERGNLSFMLAMPSNDEMREISDGFNRMAEERRRMENTLRESQSFLSSVLNGIGEGVIVIDRDFSILSANEGYCKQEKTTREEIIGRRCYEISHKTSFPCYEHGNDHDCAVKKCFETGEHHRAIHTHIDSAGRPIYIETNAYPLRDEAGNVTAAVETLMDVTERVALEQQLDKARERYRKLYDDAPDMMHSVDADGRIVICNKTEAETLGYRSEEIFGMPLTDIIAPEEHDSALQIREQLREKGFFEGERTLMTKDGRRIPVFMRSKAIYDEHGKYMMSDTVLRDISEKKNLESQLRQAQKMEAVGLLAGGVAHDFNNILTAIIGYGSLAIMEAPGSEKLRNNIEQILSASERAANLTRSLLAFSRKQIMDPKPIKLAGIVENMERLLSRVIGEDIELKTFLSEQEATVMADMNHIEQVLMNLATNARDAMPEGGSLIIETEPVYLGEEYVKTHLFAAPGRYMLISVTDTGHGMDEKTQDKVFEPFFTTKETGKGTGLGLSMVYGIVKQHNGYINVYSEPGKGTTFKIYLPAVEEKAVHIVPEVVLPLVGGSETILLAEDEAPVRQLISAMLKEYGYKVITSEDGEAAVKQFRKHSSKIDLLVLDVVMPEKSGKDAHKEILAMRPGMKTLFMSGYTHNMIHTKGVLDPGVEFINKPFSPNAFLRKVREILDA